MSLSNLFPLQLVKNKFDKDVIAEEYDLSTIDIVSEKDPHPVLQVGLCIWHQIVIRNLFQVDPRSLARYVDAQDPILYKKIEELLSIQAILDFYYANLRVEDAALGDDNECCQVCFAHTYPNDIVLSDVTFENPYKPIPENEQKYEYTRYEGLSLLSDLMQNLKDYSTENGRERILLTAASGDLVPLFNQYGFEVDDSPIAQMALAVGCGIPMQLLLK